MMAAEFSPFCIHVLTSYTCTKRVKLTSQMWYCFCHFDDTTGSRRCHSWIPQMSQLPVGLFSMYYSSRRLTTGCLIATQNHNGCPPPQQKYLQPGSEVLTALPHPHGHMTTCWVPKNWSPFMAVCSNLLSCDCFLWFFFLENQHLFLIFGKNCP